MNSYIPLMWWKKRHQKIKNIPYASDSILVVELEPCHGTKVESPATVVWLIDE